MSDTLIFPQIRPRRTVPFKYTDGGRSEAIPEEKKDCTVRALANCAEIRYVDAHAILELAGRVPKDGANAWQIDKALQFLTQLEPFKVEMVFDGLKAGNSFGRYWSPITLAALRRQIGRVGRFYCISRRHAFALIDNMPHDTSAIGPNTRILACWRIERKLVLTPSV